MKELVVVRGIAVLEELGASLARPNHMQCSPGVCNDKLQLATSVLRARSFAWLIRVRLLVSYLFAHTSENARMLYRGRFRVILKF